MEKVWHYETLTYYGKNYGSMVLPKTIIMELWFTEGKIMKLYQKPWNFDLLWKKIIVVYHNNESFWINIAIIKELWFTIDKILCFTKNYGT